jgi:hypothetical protein
MKSRQRPATPACIICGTHQKIRRHHIGGQNHVIWVTAYLCDSHHLQCHSLIETSGVVLESTPNNVERLIRASMAITILLCMIMQALQETTMPYEH